MKKILRVSIVSVIAVIFAVALFYVARTVVFGDKYKLGNKNIGNNDTSGAISTSEFKNSRNENALYDMYVSVSGNLMYLQINKIENNKVDYNIVSFNKLKDENKFMGDMAESQDNSVFCVLTSLSNAEGGRKVLNFDKGNLKKEINLDKSTTNDVIIADAEKGYSYISYKPAIKSAYPKGTPFSVISDKDNKEIENKLFIKGIVEGYALSDNYMYVNVIQAKKCDYDDVPNNYILRVDRNNLSSTVLLDNKETSIVDIKLDSKKNMYLLSNGYYSDGKLVNKSTLMVYDKNGNYIKDIKLDCWGSDLVIDSNDIAYISSRDKDGFWDQKGENITIVDTKNDKVIDKLKGFSGPTGIFLKDSYIFVADTSNNAIQVIDTNTKKVIDKIDLGKKRFPEKVIVVNNKK